MYKRQTPSWVTGVEFLRACHQRLDEQGVLTLNLIVDEERSASEALHNVRQVFGTEVLLLTEPDHDNLLVLAFRQPAPPIPQPETLARHGRHWGIDFTSMAGRITRLDVPAPAADSA